MRHPNQKSPRVHRKVLTVALASCLLVGLAPSVMAQSSNATLRGKAPTGTSVTATNTATGLTRRVNVGSDGNYALVGLPPGTYRVDAGPGTEKTVTLSVATSVTLNLAGGASAPAGAATTLDTVQVVGAPLQEVKTSEVGSNISLKQINTVPQLTRNFLEFADTVPGMQFETTNTGNSKIRGGAQNAAAVNVFIDGVGQKSYLFGGVSGQEQSAGNPFPQLAIGEYKVITSNYKAEYDQVGSAAIVAQTKSGTNEFHGEVFGRKTTTSWRAQRPDELAAGKKDPTHQNEYGAAFGGPIIQDKMHFFIAYEAKDFVLNSDPVRVPDRFFQYSDDLPAGALAQLGPATRPFSEDLYFGKIDWDIGENDRLELSAKVRDEKGRDDVGNQTAISASKNIKNTEERYDLRWQHYGEGYFNEARISYEDVLYNPTAYTMGNQIIYTAGFADGDVLLRTDATSGLAIQRKAQKGPSFQNDITFSSIEWAGSHVIKAGVKYKEVELTQSENSTANPSFFYAVGDGAGTSAIPYQVRFNLPFSGASPIVTTTSKQFGIYIQDDWDVTDKLQLNLGIRWDYEKIPSYLDNVTPQEVVDALTGPGTNPAVSATYAEQLAKGGINIYDYISNGSGRKADKNNWAPRLGFSYDFNGDESFVLFGGAGRSYDRNLYDYMGLEQVKSALSQYNVDIIEGGGCTTPAAGTCVNWNPAYLNGLDNLAPLVQSNVRTGEIDLLNNDLQTPYSDQYSLGIRNVIGEWNTSATVSYIHSKEGFVFTLGNRYPNGDFWQNGSQPWGHNPPGFGGLILGDNGIETKTTQLLLSADKPYTKESGWGFTGAYTYSHAKGNRGNDEHYAFDAGTIYDYPFIYLKSVPEHRFVFTGIYDIGWGITASAKLTLSTTPPLNEVAPGSYFGVPMPVAVRDVPGQKFLVGGDIWGVRQLDLSLSKDMHVTDTVTVQIRGDLINATNAKNYNGFITTWGDGVNYNPYVRFNEDAGMYTPSRTLFMSARVFW